MADFVNARHIVDELLSLYDDVESITVDRSNAKAAQLAHGWYSALRRTAQAVLVLVEHGHEHEASPLRRSMIEHSLALHWLAEASNAAVDAVVLKHQERIKKLKNSLTDGWSISEELLDEILNISVDTSTERTYTAFKHLCERFNQPNLYVAWLTETGTSHPTFSSAAAYLDVIDEDVVLVSASRERDRSSVVIVATLLLLGSQGFNKILVNQPWTENLSSIERRLALLIYGHPSTIEPGSELAG